MIIPKTFMLMGRKMRVDFVPMSHNGMDAEYHGSCHPDRNRIYITDEEIPRDKAEHVFLHEVVHMCFSMLGRTELYNDEALVDSFAGLLHQMLVSQRGSQ